MISPFEIYLIMQLDDIKNALVGCTAVGVATGVTLGLFLVMGLGDLHNNEKAANKALKSGVTFALFLGITAGFINMILPSSRTAAAMVLIPAIANNETIQREANDLYALAKEGLSNLAKDEEKKE